MREIISNNMTFDINEHGLPDGLEVGVLDDLMGETVAHGRMKPGRKLAVSFTIYEREVEDGENDRA
jgi:hypothetical protein